MNLADHTDPGPLDGGPCGFYNASCAAAATGVVGGVEIGYDWQDRYFVYGVAADWTWTDLSETSRGPVGALAGTIKQR